MTASTDTYSVVACTETGRTRVQVATGLSWADAQAQWRALDDARRQGLYPHVAWYAVRSTDDPVWRLAPLCKQYLLPVAAGCKRGHATAAAAARKAWRLYAPTYTPRKRWHRGVQGLGGWYYWPDGRVAAQGTNDLVRLVRQRGLVAAGSGGRWYVLWLVHSPAQVAA